MAKTTSLVSFSKRLNKNYDAGWSHNLICQKLEQFSLDVANKKSPRLLILCPPRFGKTELASINFPAWHLGKHPEHEIIAASYAVSLSIEFSRRVLNIVTKEDYKKTFHGFDLCQKQKSKNILKTTSGGSYVAANVNSAIPKRGADLIIIDDPIKSSEFADSATHMERILDWISSVLLTNLYPGGGFLGVMTRWGEKDVAAKFLNEQGWDVLRLPALAERDEYISMDGGIVHENTNRAKLVRRKGDALHPHRFNEQSLKRIKQSLSSAQWSALYQQSPISALANH